VNSVLNIINEMLEISWAAPEGVSLLYNEDAYFLYWGPKFIHTEN
jgi:hypothetical protein